MIPSHSTNGRAGFTLIELLVVIAILSVFLVMTAVVSRGAIDLNSATKARVVSERNAAAFLRQFGSDIAQRITRREARARIEKHAGNDGISLLTQRQGFALHSSVADRRASLVSYRIHKNMLERAAGGYGFGTSEARPDEQAGVLSLKGIPAAGPDQPADKAFQVIAPAIIRLEFSFVVKDGEKQVLRAEAPQDQELIEAVVATLVTLDPDRSRMLDESGLGSIANEFPDAVDNEMPIGKWTEIADALTQKMPHIPKAALHQVRVHQGLFSLPNRNSIP